MLIPYALYKYEIITVEFNTLNIRV